MLSALDASQNRTHTTRWEYDYAGRVTKETNALNQFATKAYDALGRNTSATDYAGRTTTFTYDALGRLLKQESPFETAGDTVYNTSKRYDYAPDGQVIREQTQNNVPGQTESFRKTEYTYNNRGFLTTADSYNGVAVAHRVAYTYDALGQPLTQTVDPNGTSPAVTQYTYDRFGNQTSLTDPLGQMETYIYDLAGHALTKTDRNGAVTTYAYDALGRPLTTTVTKDGAVTGQTGVTYTKTGQKATLSNANHTTAFSYDDLGRLVQEAETGNVVGTYGYDLGGNRTSFQLSRNSENVLHTTYEYDALSRLEIVRENGVTQATYTYDVNGNRASLTYLNGVTTVYTYNAENLVTNLQNKKGSAVQSSYTYDYYLDGNQRTKTDHTGRTTTYAYDDLGRLTSESETGTADSKTYAYTYDSRNNRVGLTVTGAESYETLYRYDAKDRLYLTHKETAETVRGSVYGHDSNGNTLECETFTMPAEWANMTVDPFEDDDGGIEDDGGEVNGGIVWENETSQYDGFNRLTSFTKDGETVTYAYKPDGLRLSKTQNGVTTTYIWDGQNIVAELTTTNGATGVTARYIRSINLVATDPGATTASRTYYSYNAHGDVVGLSNDCGNVTKTYRYDAFGVEQSPNAADTNPWRYSGEYFDTESGTVYLRARYYDPVVGRFTTEDPMRSGLNWYTYCLGNPIYFTDSTGLFAESDYNLPKWAQDVIWVYTSQYYNATNDTGRNVAHQGAESIRNFVALYYKSRSDWSAAEPTGLIDSISGSRADYYDKLTFHHTNRSQYESMSSLQKAEQSRDYDDIPYHFVIDGNGIVYEGRGLDYMGAHVHGDNLGNIGIALMGNFESKTSFWQGVKDWFQGASFKQPTTTQLSNAKQMASFLDLAYTLPTIGGHRNFTQNGRTTECPGSRLNELLSPLYKNIYFWANGN